MSRSLLVMLVRGVTVVLAVAALLVQDVGAQGRAAGGATGSIEEQVLQASNEWADALSRNDVEAIAELLAEDFVTIQMTNAGVALLERQVQLESLRRTAATRPRVSRALERVRVRSYDDHVAILTAVATYKADGGPPTQAVIAEVWVNTAGRWRLTHFQPTPIVRVVPMPNR